MLYEYQIVWNNFFRSLGTLFLVVLVITFLVGISHISYSLNKKFISETDIPLFKKIWCEPTAVGSGNRFTHGFLLIIINCLIIGSAIHSVFWLNLAKPLYYLYCFKSGNYMTVDGAVEGFESNPENQFEEFYIDGVKFTYYSNKGYGYNILSSDGGAVYGNGQFLKIDFIETEDTNIIVCIEES